MFTNQDAKQRGLHWFTRFALRLIKMPPRLLYALGLGPILGRFILLLTTKGRKTGLPRVTPLQFEEDGNTIYIGSMRGKEADWIRNIIACPEVQVRLRDRSFAGYAQVIVDPARIADFLELRLERRPRMVGTILRWQGLPRNPDRSQLEVYAGHKAMVAIQPKSGK